MPVDVHPIESQRGVDSTRLHAGGAPPTNYEFSGGLHGVGVRGTPVEAAMLGAAAARNTTSVLPLGLKSKLQVVGGRPEEHWHHAAFLPDPEYFEAPTSIPLRHVLRRGDVRRPAHHFHQ
jgi:DNA gyrase/topoisomerase IV subunit B